MAMGLQPVLLVCLTPTIIDSLWVWLIAKVRYNFVVAIFIVRITNFIMYFCFKVVTSIYELVLTTKYKQRTISPRCYPMYTVRKAAHKWANANEKEAWTIKKLQIQYEYRTVVVVVVVTSLFSSVATPSMRRESTKFEQHN